MSDKRRGPLLPPGYRLAVLERVESTNSEALRRAVSGDRGRLWILAEQQTAGRGRSGRKWVSAPGNLAASLLLRLTCPLETALQLSLLAGVAAAEALERIAREHHVALDLALKWPNDLMVGGPGGAKLAGILLESAVDGRPEGFPLAIGIGINIASAPSSLGRGATSLAQHGIDTTPVPVLNALAESMSGWLASWNEGRGFALVRKAFLARAGAVGSAIRVRMGESNIEGRFLGVDEGGALLIEDAQGRARRILVGDVLLAPAGEAGEGEDQGGEGEPGAER